YLIGTRTESALAYLFSPTCTPIFPNLHTHISPQKQPFRYHLTQSPNNHLFSFHKKIHDFVA
ncbi:MAG: hypothetical protein II305_05250, partial [Clostridia bacterium]|nr:hypothetical protein [Clostridia bacterium]